VVRYVHAAKVTAGVPGVHDMAVGQDVCEGAFLAKLAVALDMRLAVLLHGAQGASPW
jgi:pantothenate kinase-related protein Tda10